MVRISQVSHIAEGKSNRHRWIHVCIFCLVVVWVLLLPTFVILSLESGYPYPTGDLPPWLVPSVGAFDFAVTIITTLLVTFAVCILQKAIREVSVLAAVV